MATYNVVRQLRWNRLRRADQEALVDGDVRLTYAQLDEEVSRSAWMLDALGVGPDDVVAMVAANHADYVIDILAASRVGAVYLPLNWRLAPAEMGYILDHAGAALVLSDREYASKVDEALSGTQSTGTRVMYGAEAGPGWLGRSALRTAAPPTPYPDADREADDLVRLLYTSGTTAHPKGVMTTHANLAWTYLGQILELELRAGDRIMLSAPIFHVSGLDAPGLGTLYFGGTLAIARSFRGRDIIELAARERVQGMVLAMQIVIDFLAMPDLSAYDLSALRYIIFGSFQTKLQERLKAVLPQVRLVECFGMTEVTNGVSYMDAAHEITKRGSQGAPFPHMDIRIVDDDGRPAPPMQVGEIVLRGPKVTRGYWKDPETTALSYRDGWFHSGDAGRMDADGYLWFVDRRKDMIKSGGENIASAEVERVLAQHPAVREVAVIGVPDARWTEVPKAFVVLFPGAATTSEELIDHCRAHLARFKVPREVAIVDHLVRNDSGKVLKRVMREREQQLQVSASAAEPAQPGAASSGRGGE